MASFRKEILGQIERIDTGRIFTFRDLSFETEKTANVAVLLSEQNRKGVLVRVEKGAYYRPKKSVLGLGKLPEMDAALFQVADQPLLRRESVGRLVDFYREHPEHIAALGHDGVRGNPCLFPARLFPELLALQGDHGGNQVIRRHEEDLLLWEVPAPELTDVDTPQVLAQLRRDMAEE